MTDKPLSNAVRNFLDPLAQLIAHHLHARLKQDESAARTAEQRKQLSRLLTTAEAAKTRGIPRNSIYPLVAQKRIPFVRLGRTIYVPELRLNDWLARASDAG